MSRASRSPRSRRTGWLYGVLLAALASPVAARPAAPPATRDATQSDRSNADKPAVDWRGLDRMDANGRTKRRETPPPNPVQRLVQNAPYRVHVATTDGSKVTITDAYTLERRRVFVAPGIVGYGFSADGYWLYVAHGVGGRRTVTAVAVNTAASHVVGSVRLRRGEGVVEVLGGGGRDAIRLTLVLGAGGQWRPGAACTPARHLRRIAFRERIAPAPASATTADPDAATKRLRPRRLRKLRQYVRTDVYAPHFPARRSRVSPNTRYSVDLGRALTIHGRFGSNGTGRLNRHALPTASLGVRWMRDSRGVFVTTQRHRGGSVAKSCRYGKGLATFRQPLGQFASWRRQHDWIDWRAPDHVRLVRGDLAHQDLSWAPDGMRLVGVTGRGVVIVEPVPRAAGHVALIAPPSTCWPAVRPGVRTLATGSGSFRYAELLIEQGQLRAATARLAKTPPSTTRARLLARIAKLERVRARRLREFGGADDSSPGSFDASGALPPPVATTPTAP